MWSLFYYVLSLNLFQLFIWLNMDWEQPRFNLFRSSQTKVVLSFWTIYEILPQLFPCYELWDSVFFTCCFLFNELWSYLLDRLNLSSILFFVFCPPSDGFICCKRFWHTFAVSTQVTYHFFHWKKGTPFADDQGIYNGLTWWEQIDNGKQLTRNRKFLTVVPVVL